MYPYSTTVAIKTLLMNNLLTKSEIIVYIVKVQLCSRKRKTQQHSLTNYVPATFSQWPCAT